MALKIPESGDIRVCYLPSIPDHAVTIDVPDHPTAKIVHDMLTAVLVSQIEHALHNDPTAVLIQQFDGTGWGEIDPIPHFTKED